ncbi:hypothetical protein [Thermococcus sp.]
MSEAVNPYVLLRKLDRIERELEDMRVMLLKMASEELPEEEVDEETLRELEKDLRDMMEGKVKTLSADEAIRLLSEELED